jgi:hypothetical protein
MKRVVLDSATNTCGIPAAPAVSDVVEPSEVSLTKEKDDMKRVVGSRDSMSKDLAIQTIKKASQALHLVLNLPDEIEGIDIYDYFDQADFGAMEEVQEKLMSVYLDLES